MKPQFKLPLILLLLTLFHHITFAQTRTEQIDRLMTAYAGAGKFTGAVLVAEKGNIIYEKGLGFASYEWQVPNTPDTKFNIASVTKQFTALLVLQQVEKGKLRLDAKVSDYLPDYPKKTGEKITIHHLLSHTSGIPHYFPDFWPKYSRLAFSPEEYVKLFCDLELLSEPGTKFHYSSFGYFLLGVILEKVTGKAYEALLHENIFTPLGMKNSGIDNQRTLRPGKASGYFLYATPETAPYRDMSTAYSTGAMFSTVRDMYLWDRSLYTNQLLSEPYRKLLFTPNIDDYGYGWMIEKPIKGNVTSVYHTGGISGFNCIINRIIDEDKTIIILGNGEPIDVKLISLQIRNILYGKAFELPKKSIARTIGAVLEDEGHAAATERFRELKAKAADEYDFAEHALIDLGGYYREIGEPDKAIAIFLLNAEFYPGSYYNFSCLGDTYRAKGEKTLAISSYEKALQINPQDAWCKKYLAELTGKK